MKKLSFPLILFLLLLSPVSLAVPHYVNYQGVLRGTNGELINADLEMTFGIYANDTAEEPLWEEQYNEETELVEVRNGLFNVYLGEHEPLLVTGDGDPVFNGNVRWLQVTIGNENMDRRVPLISVPYAYNAEIAQSAGRAERIGEFGAGDFVRFAIPSEEVQETSEDDRIGLLVRSNNNVGVWGQSTNWIGVHGSSSQAAAVVGVSTNGRGVRGESENNEGVYGKSDLSWDSALEAAVAGVHGVGNGIGILGEAADNSGYSGAFRGGRGVLLDKGVSGTGGTITLEQNSQTPAIAGINTGSIYIKGKYLIIKYYDGSTTHYQYVDLTKADTWNYNTSNPSP